MGCRPSTHASASAAARVISGRPAPAGKALQDWDVEEVAFWFSKLPSDLLQYAPVLALDDGCVLATVWTAEYLALKGVSEADAARLLAYRDKALRASATTADARGIATVPVAQAAALGVPSAMGSAAAITSSASATATLTITQTMTSGAKDVGVIKEPLMAVARKGLKILRAVLEDVGPSLPFGGSAAAILVVRVLEAVESAMANPENLQALRDRALSVLDIMVAYSEELARIESCRAIVSRFQDHLEKILSYARVYASRNCLLRLLTSGSDAEQYQGLVEELARLGEELMLLLATDNNARLQAVQCGVQESLALLRRAAVYQDPAADARALVEKLGGIDEVVVDGAKMSAVMQLLDVNAQMTIEVVSVLLKSHLEREPQRFITQPELRLFWHHQFGGRDEVPWYAFWDSFPQLLAEVPGAVLDAETVAELGRLLAEDSARTAFQRAVERGNKDTISVWELKLSFRGDDALLPQVVRLVGGGDAQSGSSSSSPAAPMAAAASAARYQLPPVPLSYTGRDEAAADIVARLTTGGNSGGGSSLLLLGDGGMGKSCLAADVGWRLLREGWLPAGVLWVDLREAKSGIEVEARFCASLNLQPEKSDNTPRILAALQRLLATCEEPAAGQEKITKLLMVVDNAEDAFMQQHGEVAGVLQVLLEKLVIGNPSLRLLVTSRPVHLTQPTAASSSSPQQLLSGLEERHVGAIQPDAAADLVRRLAPDLSEAQAGRVAEACQCVPLVLQLAADALNTGRLKLEELESLLQHHDQDGANDGCEREAAAMPSRHPHAGGTTVSLVRVVLASLGKHQYQHQQAAAQLAVFPSSFDEESAAALLGLTGPGQAHALLTSLYRHSLLQWADGSRGQYIMHMLVRQEAAKLGPEANQQAKKRFVQHVFSKLSEWSDMYTSAKEWRLAVLAARHEAASINAAMLLLADLDIDPALLATYFTLRNANLLNDALGILWRFKAQLGTICERILASLDTPSTSTAQQLGAASAAYMHSRALLDTDAGKAMESARACMELRQRLLGTEHPDTATSINIFASCLMNMGNEAQAEPLYRQALELRQRLLGPEHLDTLSVMYNLGSCLCSLGKNEEAVAIQRQTLEISRRVLGLQHPDTPRALSSLAICLDNQGLSTEAETLHRQALEMYQSVLGPEHPYTVLKIIILASFLHKNGQPGEAVLLYREALELQQRVLGPNHPSTLWTASLLVRHSRGTPN
ncbi:hypothetical protein PLESTB_000816200 [Pleodorina starrii]|uniref:Kinesin light chain n=1 Tax=Pleodorina starrii TaxID=330485 RepID=A0A9W6F335_9CHLO|nr:hypothetical protein PLESTM_000131900 [Pleodorina starrii]GLC54030.1 hypothetical protein PLESTB_000816200 [Pleodorina starrii]GLC64664.1 hypothetical protein PLESTF_000190100 [Pleodorina starrii]